MDIKLGCKIHNRFDIEVKDIRTGEIVQRGQAENIVLDSIYEQLTGPYSYFNQIAYGRGTGALDPTRTSLFSEIGYKNTNAVEAVYNSPPLASYNKKKIVVLPSEAIGETITEVGIAKNDQICTHALIKDAEGNPLSIGPKTDTQEITIYATVFAEVTIPEGIVLTFYNGYKNALIHKLLGEPSVLADNMLRTHITSDKILPADDYLDYKGQPFYKLDDKRITTGRIRFNTTEGNGKVWAIYTECRKTPSSYYFDLWQILFPNPLWQGYQFTGKDIGIGDGTKTKFILPWSDINVDKEYAIYIDGALKTEGTDYTLANSEDETSVTFTTAPTQDAQITGDWWVDYIPKDEDHVLDITFTIEFGEGA